MPSFSPNWKEKKDYPEAESASGNQWAWEFLRRNRQFQIRCEAVETSKVREKKAQKLANEFGLKEFKDFRESFSEGSKPEFRFDDAKSYINRNTKKKQVLKGPLTLLPGRFLVVFDIGAELEYEHALEYQMARVFTRMAAEFESMAAAAGKKSKVRRLRGEHYATYLRVLDARECGVKYADIAAHLHQHKKGDPKSDGSLPDRVRKQLSTAETLRDGGYRSLALPSRTIIDKQFLDARKQMRKASARVLSSE